MTLDLKGKSFCIFGLPDSGKSTLANYLLHSFGKYSFVYDTLAEFADKPYDAYSPKGRYSLDEFSATIRAVINQRRYKLILIDESNRFCPSKPAPLPQVIADLNDWRAHWQMSAGFICRRPVQLNQDLTELASYLFIFSLRGKNDIAYLNDISRGLGDVCVKLPPYHFAVVHPNRNYEIFYPVDKHFATDKTKTVPKV